MNRLPVWDWEAGTGCYRCLTGQACGPPARRATRCLRQGAPYAAAGLSFGVPIGDRYGLSVSYTYSHNWERGTGGGAVGLRFTMFLGGP